MGPRLNRPGPPKTSTLKPPILVELHTGMQDLATAERSGYTLFQKL